MSALDGVGNPPSASGIGGRSVEGRADAARLPHGAAPVGDAGLSPVPGFDPFAALVEAARHAAAPPAAGLQAQLLDWVAPTARQFESVSPARLLPLLGLAVDRLSAEAQHGDDLDELGAVALERELRDHQALAERRATLIEP